MTETVTTPEDEAKAAVAGEYAMVAAQQHEYGWRSTVIDAGDYLVIFVKIEKPGGRTFVMRLRCDDYPEVAPELRFVAPRRSTIPRRTLRPSPSATPRGIRSSPPVSGDRCRCSVLRATGTTTPRAGMTAGRIHRPTITPCTNSS